MTNENSKLDKVTEKHQPSDKPAVQAPLTSNQDSKLKEYLEERDKANSFKITGHDAVTGKRQSSFTLDMGNGVEVKDSRPLRSDNSSKQSHYLPQDINGNFDTAAGKAYLEHVQEGINSIPPAIQQFLNEGRWRFRIDKSIAENDQNVAAEAASGHTEGDGTFGSNFGATNFRDHQIIVAERAKPLNRTETTYEPERENPHPDQTIRHETGHALDAALRNYSQSPEFMQKYDQCCKSLPPEVRAKLGYYLQGGGQGSKELFAELFAAEHGGGPNKEDLDPLLVKHFGPCLDLIKKQETAVKGREAPLHKSDS